MQTVKQYIRKELAAIYPETEIQGFIRLILEYVCGLDYTSQIIKSNKQISSEEREKINNIIKRLKKYEPIQYIFEETEFFNLRLKVNPSVLIPRPETEELVHWIIDTNRIQSPNILDIGTGTGCIALALKSEIESAVLGIDFSDSALDVAKENATRNKLNVDFLKANILNWEKYKWDFFDIIVSNPPYVLESEKNQMLSNVLNHEPESALFVTDENPLIFYRRIAEFAKKHLKKGGYLFFEINENLSCETEALLQDLAFSNIQRKKDLYGKERMIRCSNIK